MHVLKNFQNWTLTGFTVKDQTCWIFFWFSMKTIGTLDQNNLAVLSPKLKSFHEGGYLVVLSWCIVLKV